MVKIHHTAHEPINTDAPAYKVRRFVQGKLSIHSSRQTFQFLSEYRNRGKGFVYPASRLIPEGSAILDGGISCPRSFFHFTLRRGCALLEQQGLAHGHQLGALQGRPRDRPSAPSVRRLGPSLLQRNAAVASYEDEDNDDGGGGGDEGTVAIDVARARARARAHTPHAARVDRSADRTASDPRPQGRTCARSRPSTSKPSEDARNAGKVDRRDKKKEGSEEGKADRYEMLHSRTRSFAEYTPARARSDLGGSEGGRGAAVDNRQIQIRVMSLIM